ncbi:hypothetical protein [Streptomyces sp. TBY4]|uniref:hypothetical protein n=1 Tax=Streptomyces sp. TBY4 TaxID=2962030 RepID=UPI0020B75758|nr:hypothetical protein [Streptomyces sp. TBY4]MCP3755150.1 hypothetical protein [Streptomyces sp. TBY4]
MVIDWTEGDTTVRWSGPDGSVEKTHALAPTSVLAWHEDGETLVLVVEALDFTPDSPKDNAVVYRPDGSERFRLCPPGDLMPGLKDVDGFFPAFLSKGRPLMIMATGAGDFQGRIDPATGEIVETNRWR